MLIIYLTNMLLFWTSTLFLIFFQVKFFMSLLKLFPYATSKQKAYYLSTLNSLVIFLCSFYLNLTFFYYNQVTFLSQIIQTFTISFFTSYLLSDIFLGLVFYKEHLGLLTGYIHHTIYIFINVYSVFVNNTFVYCLYLISELPTFILCIGNLNSQLKMYKIFGIVFFSTRIVYHSFLISLYFLPHNLFPMTRFFHPEYQYTTTYLATSILGLHFYWFYKWAIKYI